VKILEFALRDSGSLCLLHGTLRIIIEELLGLGHFRSILCGMVCSLVPELYQRCFADNIFKKNSENYSESARPGFYFTTIFWEVYSVGMA
jgi:hypothetical protein